MRPSSDVPRLQRHWTLAGALAGAAMLPSCAGFATATADVHQVHRLIGLTVLDALKDDDFRDYPRLVLMVIGTDDKGNAIVVPPDKSLGKTIVDQVPKFPSQLDAGGIVGVVISGPAKSDAAPHDPQTATDRFRVPNLLVPANTVGNAYAHYPFTLSDGRHGLILKVMYFRNGVMIIEDPDESTNGQPILGQIPDAGPNLDAGGTVGVVITGPAIEQSDKKKGK